MEYDSMDDKYARFIDTEILPAVQADASVKAAYPNLKFTKNPSGRATIGCSAGGEVSFTMGWFRPDLFGRVIGYSTTLVSMQNPKLPEAVTYPEGAWDYHSDKQLIQNDAMGRDKLLRIFINVNQNDIGATRPESGKQNWVIANQRMAEVLAGYSGPAAVMSFDPDQVLALRQTIPDRPRGIIAQANYDDAYWYKLTPEQRAIWAGKITDDYAGEGWFIKTVAQWQRDTGLTRTELETARRKLKAQGLWEERRHGPPPAPLQFRINQVALYDQLRTQALAQWGNRL
jgi:hypothetical protein